MPAHCAFTCFVLHSSKIKCKRSEKQCIDYPLTTYSDFFERRNRRQQQATISSFCREPPLLTFVATPDSNIEKETACCPHNHIKHFLQATRRATATSDKIRLPPRPSVADFSVSLDSGLTKTTKNASPGRGRSSKAHGFVICSR